MLRIFNLNSFKRLSFVLFLAFIAVSNAHSQGSKRDPISAGYVYHFKTNIDGGGDVATHFFNGRVGVPLLRGDGKIIALSGSYRFNGYDFSGGSSQSIAALNPWENIHTVQLGLPIKWDFAENWSFFGIPAIRSVGESGASFSDTLSGGVITGVSYKFGDRLTLGPGIGYISQIEDSASIFPVIFVNWKITDSLALSTGPGSGATLGPGLALNWQVTESTRMSFGARYEKLRFRLDDDNRASSSGVGEDRAIPVYAAVSFVSGKGWNVSMLGGVSFGGRLDLSDQSGSSIIKQDYDPSPFLGLSASFSFR